MTGIAEHYALLVAGELPRAENQLLTRGIGFDVDRGTVLVGLDYLGRRHLLVPVGEEPIMPDRASRGVIVDERVLTTDAGDQRFADMMCTVTRLNCPFEQLVEDVVNRLHATGAHPALTILSALEDWRDLLRAALGGLSRETVIGLVAELEVMASLAASNPVAAVEGWQGPTGASHDFSSNGRNIEVKATAAVTPTHVRISNLDQLDHTLASDLHLVVLHLLESAEAPDIEERIERLLDQGAPAARLSAALEAAGYVRGMDVGVPTRYVVRSRRVWTVNHDFPGLRQPDIPAHLLSVVSNLEYDLMLAGLPQPMTDLQVQKLFAEWGKAA